MEGWLYGLFALIGVLFGGLFSYLGMKKQLEQRSEIDSRQWRRKVRSEPLLKLRYELARMANKQDKLNAAASQRVITTKTDEEIKKELHDAIDDWNTYLASEAFYQTLFMQDATDIVEKVEEIRNDYQESSSSYIHWQQADAAEELKKAMKVSKNIKARIIEVQSLINKRLEEL